MASERPPSAETATPARGKALDVTVAAVIFDMDGVITDTAALHRRSWEVVASRFGVRFDDRINDRMRGLTRPESLRVLLEGARTAIPPDRYGEILDLKNTLFLDLVARLTSADRLPGVSALIADCRGAGLRLAVASSSRNVRVVLERLALLDAFDVLVDAEAAPRSKPDPQAFLLAAEGLDVHPQACVVLEDGQAGVDAARAAGMKVVGVGPPGRLEHTDLHVPSLDQLSARRLLDLSKPTRGGSAAQGQP